MYRCSPDSAVSPEAAAQLEARRKGDKEKLEIARRLRGGTTMTLDSIARELNMGAAGYAAQCLRETP